MSYNIDSIEIVRSKGFGISREKLTRIRNDLQDELPENNVCDRLLCTDEDEDSHDPKEFLQPKSFWWSGAWSGNSFDTLKESVLPAFDGEADLVLYWEGGDSVSGLRLRDHVVTAHQVAMNLIDHVE